MRLFYAIDVPDSVKNKITGKLISVRDLGRHLRVVRPPGLHLTMLFLGEQPKSSLDEIINLGKMAAENARGCELKIGPAGFFPRVSYLTLTGELSTLQVMSSILKESAVEFLEKPDTKTFKAHITIARHKQKITPHEKSVISELFVDIENESWVADELVLYESELTPQGAIYTVVEKFKFGG